MIFAPYFNPSYVAVYVICVSHYQMVVFIGATSMAMCVSVFVNYVKLYWYWITILQESLPSKGKTSLEEGEEMEEKTSTITSCFEMLS